VSSDSTPGTDAVAVGVGMGLRYFTPIGPVRADVATPLDRDIGGSPVQLYIGIGQAF
jgi:translocation and assembly module TamA